VTPPFAILTNNNWPGTNPVIVVDLAYAPPPPPPPVPPSPPDPIASTEIIFTKASER
jgi:hypothetical protein